MANYLHKLLDKFERLIMSFHSEEFYIRRSLPVPNKFKCDSAKPRLEEGEIIGLANASPHVVPGDHSLETVD
jgi:hypothetical protein